MPSSRFLALCFSIAAGLVSCPAHAFESSFSGRQTEAIGRFSNPPKALEHCENPEERCDWNVIGQIFAAFASPEADDARLRQANESLLHLAASLPKARGWKRQEDPAKAGLAPGRVDPAYDFPFLTSELIFRIIKRFGSTSVTGPHRLSKQAEAALTSVFFDWAQTECPLADARPENVWRPWGSENHDIQRIFTCWAAAELSVSEGTTAGSYADRSSAAEQKSRWDAYLRTYIVEHATHGVAVEFFSPTYSKYFLAPFYNLADFAQDAALKRLATNFLTLWWTLWAEETIDGVHGGAKARNYREPSLKADPSGGLFSLYTMGASNGWISGQLRDAADLCALTSSYAPPKFVQAIHDERGRSFEVRTRQLGLLKSTIRSDRYELDPTKLPVERYTFVTPGYVMGSANFSRVPIKSWANIASQNRWSGVVFKGGDRVFTTSWPLQGRSTYNAFASVQSLSTLVVTKVPAPYSSDTKAISVYVSEGLSVSQHDNWTIAEARDAYVAFKALNSQLMAEPTKGGQYFAPSDAQDVIVFQAGDRREYRSAADFKAALGSIKIAQTAGEVIVTGLNGAQPLRIVPGEGADLSPASPAADWLIYSPYVKQRVGEKVVHVQVDKSDFTIEF